LSLFVTLRHSLSLIVTLGRWPSLVVEVLEELEEGGRLLDARELDAECLHFNKHVLDCNPSQKGKEKEGHSPRKARGKAQKYGMIGGFRVYVQSTKKQKGAVPEASICDMHRKCKEFRSEETAGTNRQRRGR